VCLPEKPSLPAGHAGRRVEASLPDCVIQAGCCLDFFYLFIRSIKIFLKELMRASPLIKQKG
jgi:hypothetical protein